MDGRLIADSVVLNALARVAYLRPLVQPDNEARFNEAASRYLECSRRVAEGLRAAAEIVHFA